MKRTLGFIAVAALVAGSVTPASAQLWNFPVVATPNALFAGGGPTVGIYGLYGRGLNDDSGKLDAFGGAAVLGLNRFAIKAGAMSVRNGSSEITFAGQIEAGLFAPEGSPVAISAFAGFGTLNNVISTNIPFGLAIGIAPPMEGGTQVTIFGAARGQMTKIDSPGASNEFGFGGSGGVGVVLPMGIGFGAAVDFLSIDLAGSGSSTSALGVGAWVGYNFSVGGGNGM